MQKIIEIILTLHTYVFTVDSRSYYHHTITSRILYADCRYILLDDENTSQKKPDPRCKSKSKLSAYKSWLHVMRS